MEPEDIFLYYECKLSPFKTIFITLTFYFCSWPCEPNHYLLITRPPDFTIFRHGRGEAEAQVKPPCA